MLLNLLMIPLVKFVEHVVNFKHGFGKLHLCIEKEALEPDR